MSFLKSTLPFLAMAATLTAGLAFAGVDDQIKARQDEMKANAAGLKTLVGIMRGVTPYDPALVKSSLDAMTAAMATANAAKAWDITARTGTIPTHALPAVWDDAAGFAAAMKSFEDAISSVSATADEATFKAAFTKVGQACKDCHDKYRAPEG